MKTPQAGPRKGKPAVKTLTDKQFDALVRETRQTFDGLWRIMESAASQLERQLAFLSALYGEDALMEALAKAKEQIRQSADHDTAMDPTIEAAEQGAKVYARNLLRAETPDIADVPQSRYAVPVLTLGWRTVKSGWECTHRGVDYRVTRVWNDGTVSLAQKGKQFEIDRIPADELRFVTDPDAS